MLSYNSTCRFNTGGDRRAACPIQGAGARREVFYIYIREWVPLGSSGRIWTYDTSKCWKSRAGRSRSIKKMGVARKFKVGPNWEVLYYYSKKRVPVGGYGHIIYQNAGNRALVDLVR